MKGWAWRPWLWWVFACGVGGVAGGASYVEPYLGLALFGGILGVAQWLVLRRYLSRVVLWAVFSVVGWILGYIAQFAVSGSLSGMGEAIFAWTGSEIASFLVFGPMTWAVFGIFQLPLLLRFRRALLWVPASILGGEAFVVAQNVPLLLVGEGTPGVLGGSSGMVIATTAGTIITATRGGYYYDVSYESLEMYKRPRPGVHLAVHVREV